MVGIWSPVSPSSRHSEVRIAKWQLAMVVEVLVDVVRGVGTEGFVAVGAERRRRSNAAAPFAQPVVADAERARLHRRAVETLDGDRYWV